MQSSLNFKYPWLVLIALVVFTQMASAAEPGLAYPNTSGVSDQKAGSVLFYNLYSSSPTSPGIENTDISITNTSPTTPVFVRLFFVDGITCAPAPADICLTPNTTVSFLVSDIDPGITGYILAVAISSAGCPISFNHLIGDEYIKLASGHTANLAAEAITAVFSDVDGAMVLGCGATMATISFDGVSYNRVPRVLALDKIASPASGNSTLLVVNRVGGNLTMSAGLIGSVSGILIDDAVVAFPISFVGSCQIRNVLPVLIPALPAAIPSGRTGWMKFQADVDRGIFGAAINFNPGIVTPLKAFNGGHNLHELTLQNPTAPAVFDSYIVPVSPPTCL